MPDAPYTPAMENTIGGARDAAIDSAVDAAVPESGPTRSALDTASKAHDVLDKLDRIQKQGEWLNDLNNQSDPGARLRTH